MQRFIDCVRVCTIKTSFFIYLTGINHIFIRKKPFLVGKSEITETIYPVGYRFILVGKNADLFTSAGSTSLVT